MKRFKNTNLKRRSIEIMESVISLDQVQELRKEFKIYLREKYPKWSISNLEMNYSDSFYVFNNDVGIDFWACFKSEETMLAAKDKIRDYLLAHRKSSNAIERANGYYNSMKHFKAFLDEKHPSLALEWSDKAVSNTYMKTAFQRWMRSQKKSNGEPYKEGTIVAYSYALQNSTSKLNLNEDVQADLFNYSEVDEFEKAYQKILYAPDFEKVDTMAGNKAYSNGLVLFERFLKELEEPACWIFQGNPKYYDIQAAIQNMDIITWDVNQYTKQIKQGDSAYIWLSGSEGGIIASGKILCNPEMRDIDISDPYSKGEVAEKGQYLAVDIEINKKLLDSIISRNILLADECTKNLDILKFASATNFRVTKEQQAVIESMIDGSYFHVTPETTLLSAASDRKKYWMYAPGEGSRLWPEFYEKGIMGIGWDELGDLSKYASKQAIKEQMKETYGDASSYVNAGHATWQFANEMQIGDIVFAKKGLNKIVGRGIVTSDYFFDAERGEFNNVRRVKWTHNGEWNHEGNIVLKTLTDITQYTDYCRKLEDIFTGEDGDDLEPIDSAGHYESYTKKDFLTDVYMSEDRYETLKGLLLKKKNIILQGAPGVGKTFAAERLAYSIMGEKDTSRVKVIQFHQSYSYEDFIMGYRPDGNGFSLSKGPFYLFCKDAAPDDREYFFIIDEINRGNLSKIFGELLMLIENDKRGEKHAIRLIYSDEQFAVPENVHIIGMMNTADRSLALIDYALRRRFAFFEFEPAFNTDGFKSYQASIANRKFDSLIETVYAMNSAIADDASLGDGFRIGHSYFCTNDVIDDIWLSDVVEYELIPIIKEYWFDEPSKIDLWAQRLRGAVNG